MPCKYNPLLCSNLWLTYSAFTYSFSLSYCKLGLPWWLRWQRIFPQYWRPGFNPWVRKIPWRRKWQPTPVFLAGKSHGQRSLEGYSQSMGSQRVGYNWATNTFTFTHQVNWGIMTPLAMQLFVILMKLLEKTNSFKKPTK